MVIQPSILLIEDSPGECELFHLALTQTDLDVVLHTEHDPEAAFHFLADRAGHESLPSLILLDWHLRKQHGDDFLKRLRTSTRFASIPVVIFTTSDAASDLATSYGNGANGYVVKPGTFEELLQCVGAICRFWIHWNLTPYLAETRC